MRHIAVHAHFYQPPRENPWLETVPAQPSAAPFHDWNERIAFECYGPNTVSRILDGEGRIRALANNYARLSFNVGPTLAAWLAGARAEIFRRIVAGDGEAATARGHGGALAQPYAHPILPLCNAREKRLQILWGLQDFEYRFGRRAEGIWLPETAVDLETLQALAELGLRFTILAPHQAASHGALKGGGGRPVGPAGIPAGRAYRQLLSAGRHIDLLFYRHDLSHAIAFEGMLADGQRLADRLRGSGSAEGDLVLTATDGETFGHHHRFGDMALAWALDALARDKTVRLTNPAAYLEQNPPRDRVEVAERTSWSCAHGIERWRADCGCRVGPARGGAGQAWRGPLRRALEELRDRLEELFARRGAEILDDPDAAAEDYGRVVCRRSQEALESFLTGHLRRPQSPEDRRDARRLLEMQRHALLMFASCGWFFDVLDGLEPVQVLRHAARALELARRLGAPDHEPDLLGILAEAPGPDEAHPDGAAVWRRLVRPAAVPPLRAAAHYGVMRLFGKQPQLLRRAFRIEAEDAPLDRSGGARMARGRVRIVERLTGEEVRTGYAVLHAGGREVHGGVREDSDGEPADIPAEPAAEALTRSDPVGAAREIERIFGEGSFRADDLLPDLRQEIVESVNEEVLDRIEGIGREVLRDDRGLLAACREAGREPPRPLASLVAFVLERDLVRAALRVAAGESPEPISRLVQEARELEVTLEGGEAGEALRGALEDKLARAAGSRGAQRDGLVAEALALLEVLEELPERASLWEAANLCGRAFGPPPGGRGLDGEPGLADRVRLALRLGFGRSWLEAAGTPPDLAEAIEREESARIRRPRQTRVSGEP